MERGQDVFLEIDEALDEQLPILKQDVLTRIGEIEREFAALSQDDVRKNELLIERSHLESQMNLLGQYASRRGLLEEELVA